MKAWLVHAEDQDYIFIDEESARSFVDWSFKLGDWSDGPSERRVWMMSSLGELKKEYLDELRSAVGEDEYHELLKEAGLA